MSTLLSVCRWEKTTQHEEGEYIQKAIRLGSALREWEYFTKREPAWTKIPWEIKKVKNDWLCENMVQSENPTLLEEFAVTSKDVSLTQILKSRN